MKGLSIEQKAKAYDKALGKAEDALNDGTISNNTIAYLQDIFPELKESEDEKIRKAIIESLPKYGYLAQTSIKIEDVVTWLEKYGSEPNWCHHKVDLSNCSEEYRKAYYDGWNNCNMQHSQCKSDGNDVVKCLINGMKFYYEDNKEATWGTEKFSMKVKDILSWLEKYGEQNLIMANSPQLGEQKPFDYEDANIQQKDFAPKSAMEATKEKKIDNANKVEPKFKVGDWVIDRQDIVHQIANVIENVTNHTYGYDIVGGGYFNDNVEGVRLWTIQDAKDGDVLVTKKGNLFIYDKNRYDNGLAYYYVGLVNKELTIKGPHNMLGHFGELHSVFPATKDQHDTLLKAMADAGWEFDFEKKELKKIEDDKDIMVEPKDYSSIDPHFFKTADKVDPFDKYEGLTDFERTLTDICIGWIGEELGWKQYIKDNADVLLKIAAKKFNSVQDAAFDHKPAWSYEDEANLKED